MLTWLRRPGGDGRGYLCCRCAIPRATLTVWKWAPRVKGTEDWAPILCCAVTAGLSASPDPDFNTTFSFLLWAAVSPELAKK